MVLSVRESVGRGNEREREREREKESEGRLKELPNPWPH